jgi:hypothetical protein
LRRETDGLEVGQTVRETRVASGQLVDATAVERRCCTKGEGSIAFPVVE